MTPEELLVNLNHIFGPTSDHSICLRQLIDNNKKMNDKANSLRFSLDQISNAYVDMEGSFVYNRGVSSKSYEILRDVLSDIITATKGDITTLAPKK